MRAKAAKKENRTNEGKIKTKIRHTAFFAHRVCSAARALLLNHPAAVENGKRQRQKTRTRPSNNRTRPPDWRSQPPPDRRNVCKRASFFHSASVWTCACVCVLSRAKNVRQKCPDLGQVSFSSAVTAHRQRKKKTPQAAGESQIIAVGAFHTGTPLCAARSSFLLALLASFSFSLSRPVHVCDRVRKIQHTERSSHTPFSSAVQKRL